MLQADPSVWLRDSVNHKLIMTDGTLTVSGGTYSIDNATVTITNENLDFEAFKWHQGICPQNQIKFGNCEACYIEFTMYDTIGTIKNKVLHVYIIPDFDVSLMVKLGVFKVATDTLTADRTQRDVLAYDAMYEILNADVADWYNTLLPTATSSCTLAQFRASFLSHFNLTVIPTALVNDNMTITRVLEPKELSGGDVIKAICEINGVFGHINNDGEFVFIELAADLDQGLFPSDTLYPDDELYPEDIDPSISNITKSYYKDATATYEDYYSESITQLIVRKDADDVGVTVGTAGNTYVITDNFLTFGHETTDLSTIAQNTLTKMTNRYYTPFSVTTMGNPLREVGDGISISTKQRQVMSYMLERDMVGLQGLEDTYSAEGTQTFAEPMNGVQSQFKKIAGKYSKLTVEVGNISAEVGDLSQGYTSLSLTVTGLTSTVSDISGNVSTLSQTVNSISGSVSSLDGELESLAELTDTHWSTTVKDGEISSKISQEAGQITLSSNRLVVQSTNFQLDANGNATFSGTVSGATVTGGTISGATITTTGTDPDGGSATTTISNGTISTTFIGLNGGKLRSLNEIRFGASSWQIYGATPVTVGSSTYQKELFYAGTSPSTYHPIHISADANSPYIRVENRNGAVADITPTYMTVGGASVITSTNLSTFGILTTSSEISASKITSGKMGGNVQYPQYIDCYYGRTVYQLGLQIITIDGNDYLIYAGLP